MAIHGTYIKEVIVDGSSRLGGSGVPLANLLQVTKGSWIFEVHLNDKDREILAKLGEKVDTSVDLSPYKDRDPETTRLDIGYEIRYEEKDALRVDLRDHGVAGR